MQGKSLELRVGWNNCKRLFLHRAVRNRLYAISALCLLALGFILRLIELIDPSLNGNARFFLKASFPLLGAIACVFLLLFYIRIAVCRIPQATDRMLLAEGTPSKKPQLVVISKKKTTSLDIKKVTFDCVAGWLVISNGIREIMLPFSAEALVTISQCLPICENEGDTHRHRGGLE